MRVLECVEDFVQELIHAFELRRRQARAALDDPELASLAGRQSRIGVELELTFDGGARGQSRDFRPDLPLRIRY